MTGQLAPEMLLRWSLGTKGEEGDLLLWMVGVFTEHCYYGVKHPCARKLRAGVESQKMLVTAERGELQKGDCRVYKQQMHKTIKKMHAGWNRSKRSYLAKSS